VVGEDAKADARRGEMFRAYGAVQSVPSMTIN
jgi:hypothetical protein